MRRLEINLQLRWPWADHYVVQAVGRCVDSAGSRQLCQHFGHCRRHVLGNSLAHSGERRQVAAESWNRNRRQVAVYIPLVLISVQKPCSAHWIVSAAAEIWWQFATMTTSELRNMYKTRDRVREERNREGLYNGERVEKKKEKC